MLVTYPVHVYCFPAIRSAAIEEIAQFPIALYIHTLATIFSNTIVT